MTSGLLCLVLALGLSCSDGHVNWPVQDIKRHHELFPSRALMEESLTNEAAQSAVESMAQGLKESLSKVVDYQSRELQKALRNSVGTYDEDCVRGLSSYMPKVIDNEMSTYSECTEDVPQTLKRLNKYLTSHWSRYNATYNRTIEDVNHCIIIYHDNQESRGLIEQCIKSQEERYFKEASGIMGKYNIDNSPAMLEFRDNVMMCAGEAFDSVVSKGRVFLEKMKCCVNSTAYMHWDPVKNTLVEQVRLANTWTKRQVSIVEDEIQSMNSFWLENAERYLYYQESEGSHQDLVYDLLRPYFLSVNLTGLHNPGDLQCVNDARAALHNIAKQGGFQLFEFDTSMREKTSQLLLEISTRFKMLISLMPSIGNVALLKCFSRGCIFAPDTILNCFQLTHTEFNISYWSALHETQTNLVTLGDHMKYFRDNLEYPSVRFMLSKIFLRGDTAMYELQRCIYKSSTTVYSVTTPGAGPSHTPTPTTPTSTAYSSHEDGEIWGPYS